MIGSSALTRQLKHRIAYGLWVGRSRFARAKAVQLNSKVPRPDEHHPQVAMEDDQRGAADGACLVGAGVEDYYGHTPTA